MVASWLRISPEGERALRQLNRLVVLVRRSRASLGGAKAIAPGRWLQDDLNDAAIVRGWSIVEAYLRDRGEALLRRDTPIKNPPPAPIAYMFEHAQAQIERRFEEIENLWKRALGAPLSTGPKWEQLADFRHLRNLLAHSLGRVTLPYERGTKSFKAEVRKRVSAARLAPSGFTDRLPVWDTDFDSLAELTRGLILWIEKTRP